MKELLRYTVEGVAAVYGEQSAAARALADADTHDGPVQFFEHENQILLKKLPPISHLKLN